MKFLFCIICFVFLITSAHSQSLGQLNDLMNQGKNFVQNEEYEQANLTFRRILTLNQPIPSEFCYYFAKSLFHTGQYRNSKSFIGKYYELAGQGGEMASEVQQLEEQVDGQLVLINQCDLCDENGYRLEPCTTCNSTGRHLSVCPTCKGKGKTVCDLCGGGGVLIRRNVFNNNEYHTCTRCDGSGVAACRRCEGAKEVSTVCPDCRGVGNIPSGGTCNHLPKTDLPTDND
jgi:hypothetical protein